MAFFPLVLDTSNGNQIKEIPAASELSLSGVQLTNLANLSLSGSFGAATISVTGNATIDGDTFIGGGANIAGDLSASTLSLDSVFTSSGDINTTGSITASGALSTSGNLTVFGASTLQSATLTSATISNSLTLGSQNVADFLVQSDWAVNNASSPAFIRNKPNLNIVVPEVLNDLNDVNADTSSPAFADTNRPILAWDGTGGVWIAMNQPPAGVSLSAFSVTVPDAPPGTSFDGNITYNSSTGAFTFQQPDIPRTLADLGVTNNVDTDNFAATAYQSRFFRSNSITNTDGRINVAVTQDNLLGDTVVLTFNDPGFLTQELDTLQSVTDRGANTTVAISTGAITTPKIDAQATLLDPNNIGYSSGTELTLTGRISAGGTSTFGSNISLLAPAGEIQASTVTVTDRVNSPRVQNSGNITLVGTKVIVDTNHFQIVANVTLPSSPQVGDITHNRDSIAVYVQDKDLAGNPGWLWLGGGNSPEGICLPVKTTAARNAINAVPGMMLLNQDTGTVQVWNGSAWINIGP